MQEAPKRLAPRLETLRELFLKSGNLCAFPNCSALMMDRDGVFIGQICHIQAAEPGGPRFNATMSNEERRSVSNLMLLCYEHHRVTDSVNKYSVSDLSEMKQQHERRFSRPDRAIMDKLTDWTRTEQPKLVYNLRRPNDVLDWGLTTEQLKESISELNEYINTLRNVPVDVRIFVGAIARRAHIMRDTNAVQDEHSDVKILYADFQSAHTLSNSRINEQLAQMGSYGLGGIDEIDTEVGLQSAIRLRTLKSGWPIWPSIAHFAEATDTPLEHFTEELDFTSFDSP